MTQPPNLKVFLADEPKGKPSSTAPTLEQSLLEAIPKTPAATRQTSSSVPSKPRTSSSSTDDSPRPLRKKKKVVVKPSSLAKEAQVPVKKKTTKKRRVKKRPSEVSSDSPAAATPAATDQYYLLLATLGKDPRCVVCSTIEAVSAALRTELASSLGSDIRAWLVHGRQLLIPQVGEFDIDLGFVDRDGTAHRLFALEASKDASSLQSGIIVRSGDGAIAAGNIGHSIDEPADDDDGGFFFQD